MEDDKIDEDEEFLETHASDNEEIDSDDDRTEEAESVKDTSEDEQIN